jgi:hypothetical protein
MVDPSHPQSVTATNGHAVVHAPHLLIVDDDRDTRAWLALALTLAVPTVVIVRRRNA